MAHELEYPKRDPNHIKETAGYKILNSYIPSEWMIREVSERDYGIDCYIELDDEEQLKGEIAFVQMKTTQNIDWRKGDNGFRFYKVERTTTDYLRNFKIPTYVFLADLTTKELFFVSVKEYIVEHYDEYDISNSFAYEFNRDRDNFTVDAFSKSFRRNNRYEQYRNELQYFIANVHQYVDFMQEHNNLDCFLQIESDEMVVFEAMHRNISFLQNYYETINRLMPIEMLYKRGEKKYGYPYEQTLFEGILTDFYEEFKQSVLEIVDITKELVTKKERIYWMLEKKYIFDFFSNMRKDSLFTF